MKKAKEIWNKVLVVVKNRRFRVKHVVYLLLMDIFQKKFGEVLGENTKIETPGVTEYDKRLYYYIRTYEDYPERRTYTGNYGVDIYTGELYDLTLFKKVE